HGLVVYSPWTMFSCIGLVLTFRSFKSSIQPCLSLIVIGETLLYAKWWCWWGGNCFGPRMLTDMLPLLAILLLPALQTISQRAFLRSAFVAAVIFSVSVQIIAAYFFIRQDIQPAQFRSV